MSLIMASSSIQEGLLKKLPDKKASSQLFSEGFVYSKFKNLLLSKNIDLKASNDLLKDQTGGRAASKKASFLNFLNIFFKGDLESSDLKKMMNSKMKNILADFKQIFKQKSLNKKQNPLDFLTFSLFTLISEKLLLSEGLSKDQVTREIFFENKKNLESFKKESFFPRLEKLIDKNEKIFTAESFRNSLEKETVSLLKDYLEFFKHNFKKEDHQIFKESPLFHLSKDFDLLKSYVSDFFNKLKDLSKNQLKNSENTEAPVNKGAENFSLNINIPHKSKEDFLKINLTNQESNDLVKKDMPSLFINSNNSFKTTTHDFYNMPIINEKNLNNFFDKILEKILSIKTLAQKNKGEQTFQINLKPDSMGKVFFRLIHKDGTYKAQIIVENNYLKEFLDTKVLEFRQQMNHFDLKEVEVMLNDSDHFSRNEESKKFLFMNEQESEVKKQKENNKIPLTDLEYSVSEFKGMNILLNQSNERLNIFI